MSKECFVVVMGTLSVYYSNIRGYLQGFPELCATSQSLHPDFIALVETHLADDSLQMYLPAGYVVAAHQDRTQHGGGILLLCRDHLLVSTVSCERYYVSGTSEIIGVLFQGAMIICVYRQPSMSDPTLIDSLTQLRSDHSQHPVVIVGDFNVHESDWLGSPFFSSAGTAVRVFCEMFGLQQLVDRATRKNRSCYH